MINVLRQINLLLAEGNYTDGSQVKVPAWKGIDVPDKYMLSIQPGLSAGGYYKIAGNTTQTIALPELYNSAQPLFCLISALGQVRVTAVSPVNGTSKFTLNGTSTLEAVSCWVGRITSITIATPSSTAVKVRYSLFQLPDLADMNSFRGGVYNYGILTGQVNQ